MGKIILWILLGILGLIALYFLVLFVSFCFVNPKKTYDKNNKYYRFLLDFTIACVVKLLRLKLILTGKELLPEGRFLLICNHRSNLDPIVTEHMLRKYDLAFISKPENFKVPFFGRIIRRCCFLPIDRENARNAVKTLSTAAKLIKNDEVSVAVYPEGTRSRGTEMLPFHSGVIKIAQKANVPLVIASISGTEKFNHNYPWHSTKVYLDILAVMSPEEIAGKHTTDLGDYAHTLMEKKLSKR